MKILLFVSLLVTVFSLKLSKENLIKNKIQQKIDLKPLEKFKKFEVQFQRKYINNKSEELKRQKAFENTLKKIEILKAKNPEAKFEINEFADWLDEEKEQFLSIPKPEKKKIDKNIVNKLPSNLQVKFPTKNDKAEFGFLKHDALFTNTIATKITTKPAWFDLFTLNYTAKGKVTPVKNQGSCGSCWAFAATAQIESMRLMQNGPSLDLAQQHGLQCTSPWSCNGGYCTPVLKNWGISRKAIPTQTEYPYRPFSYYSSSMCTHSADNSLSNQSIRSISVYKYPDDELLKKILRRSGPVSILVYASDWFSYAGGVFSGCPAGKPFRNHAVLLVGYDIFGNWIIKNSWGTNWGDNGYIIISKQRNCGITDATEFHYSASTIPSSTTKVNYYFRMLSSYSAKGAGGFQHEIRQDGIARYRFGSTFKSGLASSVWTISLYKGYDAEVHISSADSNHYISGFQIWSDTHSKIIRYEPGQYLTQNDVPFVFCVAC